MEAAEASGQETSNHSSQSKKTQLLLTDGLRLFLADTLTPLVDVKENDEQEVPVIRILEKKGTHGRPTAAQKLVAIMNDSPNPLFANKKMPTTETFTKWIDDCVTMGRAEKERLEEDALKGRNSAEGPIPEYVSAWAHLMKEFDKSKETAVKITRYNRVPDHLVGTGVALIHCDSSFLPGSVGVGAGKDLKKAQEQIAANKAAALAQSAEEAASPSAAPAAKTREHLEPKGKRVKTEDVDASRASLTSAIQQLVMLKAQKAVNDHGTSEINMLNQQMATYLAAIGNPSLPDAVKQNFISMLTQTQIQLQAAQSRLVGGSSAATAGAPAPAFFTPPRPMAGPSSWSSGSTGTSPSSPDGEYGLL